MDASPDRPNYTGLKFQLPTVRHTEPLIEIIITQQKSYYFNETLDLFFLANLGLCLLAHGQVTASTESALRAFYCILQFDKATPEDLLLPHV